MCRWAPHRISRRDTKLRRWLSVPPVRPCQVQSIWDGAQRTLHFLWQPTQEGRCQGMARMDKGCEQSRDSSMGNHNWHSNNNSPLTLSVYYAPALLFKNQGCLLLCEIKLTHPKSPVWWVLANISTITIREQFCPTKKCFFKPLCYQPLLPTPPQPLICFLSLWFCLF